MKNVYKILFWDVFSHKIPIKSRFGMYFLKNFLSNRVLGVFFFNFDKIAFWEFFLPKNVKKANKC